MRSLQGEFSAEITELAEAVLELRMWVEAAIDFPDDDVDFLGDRALGERMSALRERFEQLAETARQGGVAARWAHDRDRRAAQRRKSSLLNRLAGYEAAIVTPVAGTTRDVLRERIEIDGLPVHVLDTAGLRDAADLIEAEGVRRARAEIERADRVLYVVDAADPDAVRASRADLERMPAGVPVTVIYNKIDRLAKCRASSQGRAARLCGRQDGRRVARVARALKKCVGFVAESTGSLSARRRHVDAIRRARAHVEEAYKLLTERKAGELVAQEFRDAHRALGEITGEVTSDELLGASSAASA
jgi:tRNA modification GTPase